MGAPDKRHAAYQSIFGRPTHHQPPPPPQYYPQYQDRRTSYVSYQQPPPPLPTRSIYTGNHRLCNTGIHMPLLDRLWRRRQASLARDLSPATRTAWASSFLCRRAARSQPRRTDKVWTYPSSGIPGPGLSEWSTTLPAVSHAPSRTPDPPRLGIPVDSSRLNVDFSNLSDAGTDDSSELPWARKGPSESTLPVLF